MDLELILRLALGQILVLHLLVEILVEAPPSTTSTSPSPKSTTHQLTLTHTKPTLCHQQYLPLRSSRPRPFSPPPQVLAAELPLVVPASVVESPLFTRALVEAVTRASVLPIVTTTHMWTTTTLESNRAVNFCFCNLSVICIMWTIIQIVTCLEFLSLDMI